MALPNPSRAGLQSLAGGKPGAGGKVLPASRALTWFSEVGSCDCFTLRMIAIKPSSWLSWPGMIFGTWRRSGRHRRPCNEAGGRSRSNMKVQVRILLGRKRNWIFRDSKVSNHHECYQGWDTDRIFQ